MNNLQTLARIFMDYTHPTFILVFEDDKLKSLDKTNMSDEHRTLTLTEVKELVLALDMGIKEISKTSYMVYK